MNSFSLLTTPWLPVRFKDGTTGKLAPVDLADENVVDIAAPRADLQGAAWQFLLGLLQTSFAPKDHRRWDDIWEDGLEAEKLREALLSLEHAFQFGPDSPSFMQDFDELKVKATSIASLLPDAPGKQTKERNTDHFIKRDTTQHLCLHCVPLALFSIQLNAPIGGRGYYPGLRGGEPLTTLIELLEYQGNQQTPLWRKLWLNIMPQDEADLPLPKTFDDLVFPWLAPTRTSELDGAVVTDEQVNKLQAYWGMPRRIRIDFKTTSIGNCDICGRQSDALLGLMSLKNYGVQYVMWRHPLTPYRLPLKEGGDFYSVKPQPGGLIWRDWLGLIEVGNSKNNTELPAQVVKLLNASNLKQTRVGLWGFGFDFEDMKVRCWYEHHFPLLLNKKEDLIPKLRLAAQAASHFLSLLHRALKEAWFSEKKTTKLDFGFVDIDFWNKTQHRFLRLVRQIEEGQDPDELLGKWQKEMWLFARQDFDDRVFTNPYEPVDLERVMTARKKYFTTSAEKQNANAAREKKQEAAE
ncbi:TPA: type I-E CRISPR-associated protein Cse1/CasA [Escherichia coli]